MPSTGSGQQPFERLLKPSLVGLSSSHCRAFPVARNELKVPVGTGVPPYLAAAQSDSFTLVGAQVTQICASSEWRGWLFLCIFSSWSSTTHRSFIHPIAEGAAWQAQRF